MRRSYLQRALHAAGIARRIAEIPRLGRLADDRARIGKVALKQAFRQI